MNCLGIESTAHTFGVGIVSDKKILANVKDTFTTEKGGMIPSDLANHHEKVKDEVLVNALKAANLSMKDINLISYSAAPGIAPPLMVGLRFAKELAKKHNIPLVGVNHSVAHLSIGDLITGAKDPIYLYVSGPNTQVIGFAGGRFRVFGETLDLGLGNMLDKFAREIGLGFPGGPKIEQLAKGKYVELPYSVKGMDVSFAGMLTKALRLFKQGVSKEDLCFSLQETSFAMLAEVAERAMAHVDKKELLLIGGVAANKRLCRMLEIMCKERDARFFAVPLEFSGDQGVMIAWQGVLQKDDVVEPEKADVRPYERIDEVEVTWK
ncbi:N(6)-L-threonylcarbamoyladenine synthase Kae1 [Candidatus Woesearchaeota archaeon]|nr:N(6)-L-threonylcarbamoyladenine synthase Kae1 [Candidatus Woesearchaeota archaeon]MBW3016369.1 N(6)-L-threonylcarbamoyladenine synthase Kae1 [Candidatus Woesearchaeota archaeon]